MQPGLCLLQCEPQENKRGYVIIVRILQRNRTDRTFIRTEGDLLQGIGSRGYGRGQVPRCTVLKLEPQESPWCSSSPKTCWLQPQEEPVFQGESTSRNKTKFQLRAVRQEEIPSSSRRDQPFVLFRPSTHWTRLTHIGEANLLYSVYRFKY